MKPTELGTLVGLALMMSGCGTHVPEIQDFWEGRDAALIQVDTLKDHVTCDVITAVRDVLAENDAANIERAKHPNLRKIDLNELKSWTAEVLLTLSVEEKGQFNPSFSLGTVYPNAVNIFRSGVVNTGQTGSLALAGNLSSDATRKITLAYGIDLSAYFGPHASAAVRNAVAREGKCFKPGAAFTDGDLKFASTLKNSLAPAGLDEVTETDYLKELSTAEKATKKDVISHEVTFVIIYGANINPSLKLVSFQADQGMTPLLGSQRTNTQDVLITLGPKVDGQPSPLALSTIIASQINIGIINNRP